MIRQPHADESDRVAAARVVAVRTYPYFARAMFATTTMVSDAPIVGISPGLTAVLPAASLWDDLDDLADTFAHLVQHWVRRHASRLAGCADATRAGLAACLELGDPDPVSYALPAGEPAEVYYQLLESASADAEGHGSGSGGDPQGWEDDADGDGIGEATGELIRRQVARDIVDYQRSAGDVPGDLVRWAEGEIADPVVPWSALLRQLVGSAVDGALAGSADYTWRRRSRRGGPDTRVITPGVMSRPPHVGVVIDTSGSMNDADLSAAVGEVHGICRSAAQRVTVWSCDADAATGVEVRQVQALTLTGGGGTDMTAGIAAAASHQPPVDAVVVITDGWTPWPAVDPGVSVIVVLVGDADVETPPWAQTVRRPTWR